MRELVKNDQSVTIVPMDFNQTNKGVVIDVSEKGFKMKMKYPSKGIPERVKCEFYSQTPNGILFFESYAQENKDNILTIANPVKHRFLQRRQFTRVKFEIETTAIYNDEVAKIKTIDLSAGGTRFTTDKCLSLENLYDIDIILSEEQNVICKFQPIRLEKLEKGGYMISGRFIDLVNVDKMTLIQFCMKKNMEALNQ